MKYYRKSTTLILICFSYVFLVAFTPMYTILNNQDILNENHKTTMQQSTTTNDKINKHEINNYIDSLYYIHNKEDISRLLINNKEEIISLVTNHINNKQYSTASTILDYSQKFYKNDNQILSLINLNNQKNNEQNLKEYHGDIEVLSFSTLIAYPEKAFDPHNNFHQKYDNEKITINEFKKILNQLYLNDYILIDIDYIYHNQNNTLIKNKLLLPQNKKPLILTFENASYIHNYQNMGEIDKIIIDRNGELATYTSKTSIQDRVNYNNEFIVILENFIKEHNDFSFNNARGLIFFTGSNGILGYNTTNKNASSKQESKKAHQVIRKLSSLGWKFGCNNYTYQETNTISNLDFAKELSLWNNEIKTIIGSTPYFSYPYGNIPDQCNMKKDLLTANGFNIFFYDDNIKCNFNTHNNICYISKRNINGTTLRSNNQLSHLFNCEDVYDHTTRPTPFLNTKKEISEI